MEAIVLAGGLGTRLRSVVGALPKPMAPIAGRPFLDWLVEHLERCGVDRILLSVGYGAEQVESHFAARAAAGSVRFVREDSPLGTGGAIARALAAAEGDVVFVLNGDTFLDVDLRSMRHAFERSGTALMLALKQLSDAHRYETVSVQDGVIRGFFARGIQRSGLINAGVYVMRRHVFDGYGVPKRFSFENDFLKKHVVALEPAGFVTDGYFIDIGVPEDYARACEELPARLRARLSA